MLSNLFKCVRNAHSHAHVSPHAVCRAPNNQTKWRKCNFISIQFEMWPFFRPFCFSVPFAHTLYVIRYILMHTYMVYMYRLPPLCLLSSKLKPLKLKAYFIPFRSFSLSLSFHSAAAAVAANVEEGHVTSHPLRAHFGCELLRTMATILFAM